MANLRQAWRLGVISVCQEIDSNQLSSRTPTSRHINHYYFVTYWERHRRGLSLLLGVSMVAALFGVNMLAGLFLNLEQMSWLFGVIGVNVALLVATIQVFRAAFGKSTGTRFRDGRRPCPDNISVFPRQPTDNEFVERDFLVDELRSRFQASTPGAKRVVVLTGPFGVGKTRIAQELAKKAVGKGVDVAWVACMRDARINCAMCAVAHSVGINREELARGGCATQPIVRALRAHYRKNSKRWLLIIDEANDLSVLGSRVERHDGTSWIFPPDPSGMIVITTLDNAESAWNRTWVDVRRIHRLDDAGAVKLLTTTISSDGILPRALGSQQDAERLGSRLGFLPLALRLTGLYFRSVSTSGDARELSELPSTFSGYIRELNNSQRWRDWDDRLPNFIDELSDRKNLTKSWDISVRLLEAQGVKCVRALLGLLAGLSTDTIPYERVSSDIFSGASRSLRQLGDPRTLRHSLRRLTDIGLLEELTVSQPPGEGRQRHEGSGVLLLNVPSVTRELAMTDPKLKKMGRELRELRKSLEIKAIGS